MRPEHEPAPRQGEAANLPRDPQLAGPGELPAGRRSLLLEVTTRFLYPTMLVVATYLLLVGLHRPGGGFAAGLVACLALVLRRVAAGPHELGEAALLPPGVVLGVGLTLAAGYAAAGALLTGEMLSATSVDLTLPGREPLHVPSSLLLEVAIALIVVGLVLDVLRTLGGEDS